jgi:Zn-finger nucleic acid-binding protein
MSEKMKQSEIPKVRKMLVAKQNGVCPICGRDLTRMNPVNVVIDHCHTTGYVRAAMCRGCNKVEGSVKNLLTRWGKAKSVTDMWMTLERLVKFWKVHSTPQTDIIYYGHKTAAEKRAAYNAKRRRKANARKNN